tara:strand:- start:9800 stop:10915 length:1116 start_codon:yes stop_codon:yes gene_type:complete
MKIKIYKEFNKELKVHWNKIENKSNHFIFQRFDWLGTWQKYIGDNSYKISPNIIVLFDNDLSPKIIFPLGIIRKLGVNILTFLGGGQSDYNFPLIDNGWINNHQLLTKAWLTIYDSFPSFDVLHLDKFPKNIFEDSNPFLKILNYHKHDIAYYSKIPKSIEEFESKIRSKVRTDTKRQLRRLNKLPGKLKIDLNNISNDNVEGIKAMIEQKKKKYKLTNVPDIFKEKDVEGFYLNLHKYLKGEAYIHFSTLKYNNRFLSTHWGAIHNKRFYFLMPSYESGKYAVYSPGKVLLYSLMENSINNKLEIFDFTIGAEQYKKDWCDFNLELYEYFNYKSLKGYIYVLFIKFKRIIKRNPFLFDLAKRIYGFKNKF